jgi:hypothetical protein
MEVPMHGRICGRMRVFLRAPARSALAVLATLAVPLAGWLATPASAAEPARLGKTTVGASKEGFAAERKHVNAYRLPVAGKVSGLSVYLESTTAIGQQEIEGVLYSEGLQEPEELLNVSFPMSFTSGQAAGWYALSFPIASELSPGSYWLGVVVSGPGGVAGYRYDTVAGAGAYNANSFAFGPTNPFGQAAHDSQQVSLYATYTPQSGASIPENTSPPTIAGAAVKGQQLIAGTGVWTGSPTGYGYAWQRCNSAGAGCTAIAGATSAAYTLGEADVGSTLRVSVKASNEAGTSSPVSSAATAVVSARTSAPVNTSAPTISGTPRQGATLTETHGVWTGEPTSYSVQWLQCNALGQGCLAIAKATGLSYTLAAGDVGHEIAVQETASNSAGPGEVATSAPTAVVLPLAPTNTAPPTISGTAQQGATLTEAHGSWTGEPTGFSAQWMQCEASGGGCHAISGATGQTYVPTSGDVGHAIRVSESATNAGGTSAAALSSPTAAVAAQGTSATFGKTTVGAVKNVFAAERKRVNEYALPTRGAVSELSIYLEPGTVSGQQQITGVIYADANGAPGALLATSKQLTYASSQPAGWYHMSFSTPIELPAGNYWIGELSGPNGAVAGYRYDNVAGARDYNQNSYAAGPSNPFGAFTNDTQQISLYATYVPAGPAVPQNTSPPVISGTTQKGQQLSASTGAWSGSPTSYAYEWLRCNSAGATCSAIAGATSSSYTLTEADVGSTLRVAVSATNAAGESEPATSAQTAVVSGTVRAPTNTAPPTISGTAQQGATLTETHGVWTGEPTSFSVQWMQCEASGSGCHAISAATGLTYVPTSGDVGHTIRVSETATNAGGTSSPALSAPTATVAAQGTTATFGTTAVGAQRDGGMFANYKIVHRAILSASGTVTKLSLYAIPGINSPAPQSLRALIYADSGGSPGALLAAGPEVVYRGNVNGTGWFELPLSAPVSLSPGTYWIGFFTGSETEGMGYAFESVTGSRAYNTNTFSSGPTNPFGTSTKDAELASLYATYTPSGSPVPQNTSLPVISGSAQQGQQLSASTGAWSGSPTSYAYEWLRCDSAGASCSAIAGAISSSYTLTEADVGSTLRVAVSASNQGGESEPAISTQTAVVSGTSASAQHLEYVLQDGVISVYDMDHEFKLMKTISLPQTKSAQVRGVTVAPTSHLMFVMYGGDGPINGSGTGSVLAYDLVNEKVVWERHLSTGIDSGQVSPDGSKLYIPTGENTESGIWNVLSAQNGEVIGTIKGGSGAHNTVVSADGQYVYLAGRLYNFLDVYETATGKVREIGPMVGSVRPFTVNGSNTLAFTTATNFDGFQVSSIPTGKVLWTVSFGEASGLSVTAPSHGAGLSPDEHELYVVDYARKEVQFWNVAHAGEGVAPTQIGVVPVSGLTGESIGCLYDCQRSGWLQLSSDGRYLFVGDSGEVIETATRKVVTVLSTLAQSKYSIEVDWQGGVPVATSGRTGVGRVG